MTESSRIELVFFPHPIISTTPAICRIPGGPVTHQFPARSIAGKCSPPDEHNPVDWSAAASASSLIYRVEQEEPAKLVLNHYKFTGHAGSVENTAVVAFDASILPSIICTELRGTIYLALVTADSMMHVICLPNLTSEEISEPLVRLLKGDRAVVSLDLQGLLHRLGTPSCFCQHGDLLCMGTEAGNILCMPLDNLCVEAAFELKSTPSGLSLTKVWMDLPVSSAFSMYMYVCVRMRCFLHQSPGITLTCERVVPWCRRSLTACLAHQQQKQ
jgi:hypothetical protein